MWNYILWITTQPVPTDPSMIPSLAMSCPRVPPGAPRCPRVPPGAPGCPWRRAAHPLRRRWARWWSHPGENLGPLRSWKFQNNPKISKMLHLLKSWKYRKYSDLAHNGWEVIFSTFQSVCHMWNHPCWWCDWVAPVSFWDGNQRVQRPDFTCSFFPTYMLLQASCRPQAKQAQGSSGAPQM